MDAPEELHTIPPLPLGKSVVEVYSDFLRYLFSCTKRYIQMSHPSGKALWGSLEGEIHFVLTHPNSYEGPQQTLMRQAVVMAGLVADDQEAQSRVSLVTEGEACLHYCVQSGLLLDPLKVKDTLLPYPIVTKRIPIEWTRCHDYRRRWRNR